MMKKWKKPSDCNTCMAKKNGLFDCSSWSKECGDGDCSLSFNGRIYYANKVETEALLDYHNKKHGTIRDRLSRESDGETMRFGYVDGEWKEIEEMDDKEFRVKDKVTIVDNAIDAEKISPIIEGVVCTVSSKKFPGSPIGVEYEHELSTRFFHKDGSNSNPKCHLYHGHNLKVTVEEKKPVRTVEKILMVYVHPSNKHIQSDIYDTERDANESNGKWTIEGWKLIQGPVKVKIPE